MSSARHEHYLIRIRRQLSYLLNDVDRILNNPSIDYRSQANGHMNNVDKTRTADELSSVDENVDEAHEVDYKECLRTKQNNDHTEIKEGDELTTTVCNKSNIRKKEPPIVGPDIGTNDIIDAFCMFCVLFIIVSWIIRIMLRLWLKYRTDSRNVVKINQNYPIQQIDSTGFASDKYMNHKDPKLITGDSMGIQPTKKQDKPTVRNVCNDKHMTDVPHRSFQDRVRHTIRNLTGSSNGITTKPFVAVTK